VRFWLKSANVKVVRNIFEHFSYDVLRIDRVSFAGLTKKNLPRGNWDFYGSRNHQLEKRIIIFFV
jgi:16S rRNA U516 pseudouridylate synthase RsuA-like enzyme